MSKTKRHRKPSEELPVLYLRMPVALGRDLRRATAVLSKLAGLEDEDGGGGHGELAAGARELLEADVSKAAKVSVATAAAAAKPPRKRKPSKLATPAPAVNA